MSHPHIAHADALDWIEPHTHEKFFGRCRRLAQATGGKGLGCNLFELAPGKTSFPYHCHYGNEEAIYVLEGELVLRLEDGEHELGAGHYATFPAGPEGAHQIFNRSGAPVRYLCMSTMVQPDVVSYPDGKKFGLFAGAGPGGAPDQRPLRTFVRDEPVGYLDGEE